MAESLANANIGELNVSNNQYIKYRILVVESSPSDATNTSSVNIKVIARRTNSEYTGATNYAGSCSVRIDGGSADTVTWNYDQKPIVYRDATAYSNWQVLYNKTKTITHNDDGERTIKVEAKFELHYSNAPAGEYKWSSNYQGANVELIRVNVNKITLSPLIVGINTINFTANASKDDCDLWSYSLDAGKTFTEFSTTTGRSVTKELTGLSPNTMYRLMVQARKAGTSGSSAKIFKSTVYRCKTTTNVTRKAINNTITLFERNETDFKSNGLGSLSSAVTCTVTEELNGAFELEMEYPITGNHFSDITYGRIIFAKPNEFDNAQPFRIYAMSRPHNGIVTINAEHISYDLTGYTMPPFKITSVSQAFGVLNDSSKLDTPCPFTFLTDKSDKKTLEFVTPVCIRSLLGGSDKSILENFGGEYEFDGYQVNLWSSRGSDRGVVIRYGKNLTSLKQDENINNMYTHVRPYWYKYVKPDTTSSTKNKKKKKKEEGGLVQLSNKFVPVFDTEQNYTRILLLDLTNEFDTKPSESALRSKTQEYINKNNLSEPEISLDVSFVQLSDSREYHDIAMLERVQLADTVTVEFPELGVFAKSQVIQTVYDVLSQRYESIELGNHKTRLATTLADNSVAIKEKVAKYELDETVNNMSDDYQDACDAATNMLSGYGGGSVVLDPPDNPVRLLLMDNEEMSQAQNVWQWNINGLGFSNTGINGNYGDTVAITSDGKINATYIATGAMNANYIEAGTITADQISVEYTERIDAIDEALGDSVNELTSTIRTTADGLEQKIQQQQTYTDESITTVNNTIATLDSKIDGIEATFSNQVIGGINKIANSSGLNDLDNNWTKKTGSRVSVVNDEDIIKATFSGSAFKLDGYISPNESEISQKITTAIGAIYTLSVTVKNTSNTHSYIKVVSEQGDKELYVVDITEQTDWEDYNLTFENTGSSYITLIIGTAGSSFYASDLMLTEGNTVVSWTPGPNEIYTEKVRIDRDGISISNSQADTSTNINEREFAVYHQGRKVLTVNKDVTELTKTEISTELDGYLTIGKGRFIPRTNGLDFVLLD